MKYSALVASCAVFAAIWFTLMGAWIGLSFLMSDGLLRDLPSRPLFSGYWRTSDGMLVFAGQANFATTMIGALFVSFLATFITISILRAVRTN